MGLLKTVGTVAAASAVHGRVQRRQQQRWAAQDQAASAAAPPAPPPQAPVAAAPPQAPSVPAPPASVGERLDQLKQLGELLNAGILTEAEFQQQKARILNG